MYTIDICCGNCSFINASNAAVFSAPFSTYLNINWANEAWWAFTSPDNMFSKAVSKLFDMHSNNAFIVASLSAVKNLDNICPEVAVSEHLAISSKWVVTSPSTIFCKDIFFNNLPPL